MSLDEVIKDASKYIDEMRKWVNTQPHLPKDIDDRMLLRFAHSTYYDLEQAKVAAEAFFNIRGSIEHLLNDRDPLTSPTIINMMNIVNVAYTRTAGNTFIWMWQLNDPGLQNYDYFEDVKYFFLFSDAFLMYNTEYPDVDIVIYDVKDISIKFITKFSLSNARTLLKYQQEAMPIRLKQVHFINSLPIVDKVFSLVKPFLKKDVADMFHFHPPNSENLFKYIDKEYLPLDFGGTRPPMAEQNKHTVSIIMSKRKELTDEKLWRRIPVEKKNKKGSVPEANPLKLGIQ